MATPSSSLTAGVGRIVKWAMVALIVPLAVGLLQSFLEALDVATASGRTYRQWAVWGFTAYVGMHLLLYRPVGLFRVSHRLFSTLAVWLFGGQVASTEGAKAGRGGASGPTGRPPELRSGRSGARPGGESPAAQGSTLVAFSPYVIPLYVILVSLAALVLRHRLAPGWVDVPVGFLLGFLMAFHWIMTADDLQQQRDRWHIETYLLALGLVFVFTLLIGGSCLPWAVPGFSFVAALSDALARTQAMYGWLVSRLFL